MIRIGVLALQGDFAEHVAVLSRLGVEAREVRLPEQLDNLDGLVIPGGESTTFTRLMADYDLLEPIRRLAEDGLPIWGTCAGMIVLACQASHLPRPGLGIMDIVVERNAFGRQVDSFEADVAIPVLGPEPFPAVFIRAPVIRKVGIGVEVLARLPASAAGRAQGDSPDGTAIVAARQGHPTGVCLLATAFHPELTNDTRLHRYFLELVEAGGSSAPEAAAYLPPEADLPLAGAESAKGHISGAGP
jgi:5'-phosphate synthase pdxT subunit